MPLTTPVRRTRYSQISAQCGGALQELGGYGGKLGRLVKYATEQAIVHQGEVNRARVAPFNPNLIASRGVDAEIFISDRVNQPGTGGVVRITDKPSPDVSLTGLSTEGFPLDWGPTAGHLAAGDDSGRVCCWDLNHPESPTSTTEWGSAVCDLAYHPAVDHAIILATDASTVMFDPSAPTSTIDLGGPAMCARPSPTNPHLVAIGRVDSLTIVDLRAPAAPLSVSQTPEVYCLDWSPHVPGVLAAGYTEGRVELRRVGRPEPLFTHFGHVGGTVDLGWHPVVPWTVGSVGNDGRITVFQPDTSLLDI